MAPRAEPSPEYLAAARRKIEIAGYHHEAMQDLLVRWSPRDGLPPIPVQAHFEGVLFAFVAATDQLAEGIDLGSGRGGKERTLDVVLPLLPDASPWRELRDWSGSAIVKDVRGIRVRATHHHYRKVPGGLQLEVEPPSRPGYDGPRTLGEYSAAAVAHLRELGPIIAAVEQELGSTPQGPPVARR